MTNQHPITPPEELVEEWGQSVRIDYSDMHWGYEQILCAMAAQWGADQQLEATDTWIRTEMKDRQRPVNRIADDHRADMRPKPLSLKERALQALDAEASDLSAAAATTIRRALEALDD